MKKRTIFAILTIIWIMVIWGHSMIPAKVSSQESGVVVELLNKVAFFLHLPAGLTDHFIRKSAHFSEYAVLGFLVCGFRYWGKRTGVGISAFSCLMVALIDETIQLFVEGRSGQITDVWIDFLGALCVILIYNLVRRANHEKKNSNSIRS